MPEHPSADLPAAIDGDTPTGPSSLTTDEALAAMRLMVTKLPAVDAPAVSDGLMRLAETAAGSPDGWHDSLRREMVRADQEMFDQAAADGEWEPLSDLRTPGSGPDDLRHRACQRAARMFVDFVVRMESGDHLLRYYVTNMLQSSWHKEYRSKIVDQLTRLASITVVDPEAWAAILAEHLGNLSELDPAAWAAILAEHLLDVSLEDPEAYADMLEQQDGARAAMRQ